MSGGTEPIRCLRVPGSLPRAPVQRIHHDTQPLEVGPLQSKGKFVAVPALVLLDGSGQVVDMLQGEVTDKEIATSLR